MQDDIACHILDPRKHALLIPYPVAFGLGAKVFLQLRKW